ncbi:hypothetical protein [Helicobacter equorum]|uniref:hypothetical protein n=1 Tax=Helicobacter equorum TaxID=361872 RepID=UPI000CF05DAD|nr:hypothetical protein [Helicobacter equorum]
MQFHSFNVNVAKKVGVNKAILLQYIEFWVDKNKANKVLIHEGKAWVYHTASGFEEIFSYMKANTIAKYLVELEKEGYLHSSQNIEKGKNRNNRVKYYTLGDAYFSITEKEAQNQNECAKNQNEPAQNQNECAKNQNVYNDISLENNNISKSEVTKELDKQELDKQTLYRYSDKIDDFFAKTWEIYPRKVGKKEAKEKFKRKITTHDIFVQLLNSIRWHKENVWVKNIAQGKLEFIPHLATFINKERYLDEQENTRQTPKPQTMHTQVDVRDDILLERAKEMERQRAKESGQEYNALNVRENFKTLKAQEEKCLRELF